MQQKLIEGNFPCREVGAETKRERGASSSLPPLYFLHVWWARRPLTPSRAAILGSILPAETAPEEFLTDLGIVKKQAIVGDQRWTLVGKNLDLIVEDEGEEVLLMNEKGGKALQKEIKRRQKVRTTLEKLAAKNPSIKDDNVFQKWWNENEDLSIPVPVGEFHVITTVADPAGINDRINLASSDAVLQTLGQEIKIDDEDLYGYGRAYSNPVQERFSDITVLDPTAGGGSIPFEAERLGCHVIANDLNPVATGIEIATLKYPAQYGLDLLPALEKYGNELEATVNQKLADYFHFADLPKQEQDALWKHCNDDRTLFDAFNQPEIDQQGYLYCREVTCPHCGERTPLLNAFALSKKTDGWMVVPEAVGVQGARKILLHPVRLVHGKGPHGESPELGSVKSGIGRCLHCQQAIESEEIKRQARGESEHGTWSDRLYCVVGVREQPKRDKQGNILYYKSGPHKGEVRTETVTFFREPTAEDFAALRRAAEALQAHWEHWEDLDLIPTETIPEMNDDRPRNYGSRRWCDMFTPRQLLSHLTAMETLHDMMPAIRAAEGEERGNAIIHYLQYMLDKGIDYNSRQTRWIAQRGSVSGTFSRHDFSLKWTFGELVYTGPHSGLAWGESQVLDAYKGICELLPADTKPAKLLHGSAANLDQPDKSVDVVCVDPPYYNNVQYAELSDYFYVWQKRTLGDIYPAVFGRRLTNKQDEAVANPVRDGSAKDANDVYEQRMGEIFAECRRVLKDDGLLTMMFTHKTQAAWETLTHALIENGWIISSAFPVDSEFAAALNQKDLAAAASSIFLACRKRDMAEHAPAIWSGFGGQGVQQDVRHAVAESLRAYAPLHLNAVDEMVASYGSALRVLSQNWPVMDGDAFVTPMQAMHEASTVVAQYGMERISGGSLHVSDLAAEAGIALTLFGIYGLQSFPYDDALSLAKSLSVRIETKAGGYHAEPGLLAITDERRGRRQEGDEATGYYAPIAKKGSKLRLVLPEERHPNRIEHPQQEWDVLQGLLLSYRKGDIPVARAYLDAQAPGEGEKYQTLLRVWSEHCGDETLRKEAERLAFGLKG